MTTRPKLGDFAVPFVLLGVLSVVASLGFRGIFPSWEFVPAAIVAAAGAAAVALLGRWLSLTVTEAVLASAVAFVPVGAIAVSGIPTPEAFGVFFDGLTSGWAEVLSSTPPADITAEFRVLPFTVSWLAMLLGAELLRVERVPGLAAVGPVAAMTVSMLITLEDRTVALVQGVIMAVGAIALGFWQQRQASLGSEVFDDVTIESPNRRTGLVSAGLVLAVLAVAAPVVGPRLPLANANERFDLREYQTPPYDPLRQPTPLVQVKASLQEENADIVVFSVTSETRLSRFPLAVLDHYNGEYWAVADESVDAGGQFRPVDSAFPQPSGQTLDGWGTASATFEIVGMSDIAEGDFDPDWLPLAGWPVSLDSESELDLRFNADSGTLALAPEGADAGLQYSVEVATPPSIESLSLREATVTKREPLSLAVPQINSFAGDVLEGADVGWEQVEAIRTRLVDGGAYDSRQASVSGRSGHSLGRIRDFLEDPDRVVGFEEQYAATAALLARSEGLPARVVVGFLIPPDDVAERWADGRLDVVANDMGAWIEVGFDGIGWLPFDVTPPRDRLPEDTTTGRSQREVAVPNPPPEPPPPVLPPELDRDAEVEEEDEDEDEDEEEAAGSSGFPYRAAALGVAAVTPFVLLLGCAIAIVVLKRRRTDRRRRATDPSLRVAGAWHEVVDRYEEQGAKRRAVATPAEYARGLRDADLVGDDEERVLLELARDASTAAFHPSPATDSLADSAWTCSDRIVTDLDARSSGPQRLRHKLDPRPLLRKDPLMEVGAEQ